MKRRITCLLFVTLSVCAETTYRIMPLGDSITYGW
jgi:hypothetical protein